MLWLLGMVTSYTMGGLIHVLLVIAVVCDPGSTHMNPSRLAALVLIIAGGFALAYGSFSYTRETHDAKIGPLELSVRGKETVNVPVWAGVGAIVLGGVLLFSAGRKA